jgi:hypothetical protein
VAVWRKRADRLSCKLVVAVLADAHEHPIVPCRRQYLWPLIRRFIFAVANTRLIVSGNRVSLTYSGRASPRRVALARLCPINSLFAPGDPGAAPGISVTETRFQDTRDPSRSPADRPPSP